jgi:hypothetical protein
MSVGVDGLVAMAWAAVGTDDGSWIVRGTQKIVHEHMPFLKVCCCFCRHTRIMILTFLITGDASTTRGTVTFMLFSLRSRLTRVSCLCGRRHIFRGQPQL